MNARLKTFAVACVLGFSALAQTETPLAYLQRVKKQALAYTDQKISFTSVMDAPGRNGQRVQRKTSGKVEGDSVKSGPAGQTAAGPARDGRKVRSP
ncbi:MAG: hypothetical protein RL276_1590 [Bacteroidota bacterium]